MKTRILLLFVFLGFAVSGLAQSVSPGTLVKRERRKSMTVKEWNLSSGSKQAFLDHVTTYDSLGRKIEEIEYASYGLKSRVISEYPANSGVDAKVSREIEYNDRNKVARIRKYEYYEDGTRKRQINYFPNGKLEAVKTFEYISGK